MEGRREDHEALYHLREPTEKEEEEEVTETETTKKKVEQDGELTGRMDITVEGALREVDPVRFKKEIRRWARAVVRYARQLSRSLSSASISRSRRSSVSSFSFNEHDGFGNPA